MKAFMSYQTADRHIAAELRGFLETLGIPSFMAHEDIQVSHEWQTTILKEIGEADIFVAVLSANYLTSPFCMQESGIAVFRGNMTIIPLSIDATVSPGFMGTIQSKRINPAKIDFDILVAGIAKHNQAFIIDHLIERLRRSGSYRVAETNFLRILPYLGIATDEQKIAILAAAAMNDQISNAGLLAQTYLPPIFATHGQLLKEEARDSLGRTLKRYAVV